MAMTLLCDHAVNKGGDRGAYDAYLVNRPGDRMGLLSEIREKHETKEWNAHEANASASVIILKPGYRGDRG